MPGHSQNLGGGGQGAADYGIKQLGGAVPLGAPLMYAHIFQPQLQAHLLHEGALFGA